MATTKKKTTAKKKAPAKAATKNVARRVSPASIVRLERGEGEARVFWEIARTKTTLTIRRGRYLYPGTTSTKELASVKEATAAFTKAIADKRAEGYTDPTPREVVGASSRKGVSARNPEIEAFIDEDPSDPQRYLVYADWLQQQGDPRGELVMIHHGLVHKTDNRELDALETAETQLMKVYAKELLGPIAKYTHVRTRYGSSFRGLAWRYGFVCAARITSKPRAVDEAITELFGHPSGRFIQRLVLSGWSYDVPATVHALSQNTPPTLTTLVVGTGAGWGEIRELGAFLSVLPRVKKLALTSVLREEVTAAMTASIEDLEVALADEETLINLAKARWPKVRRLRATLVNTDDAAARWLVPLFAAMPMLEHAVIRRPVDEPQDAIGLEALRIAVARRLPHLGLELEFSNAALSTLLTRAHELRTIGRIRFTAYTDDEVTRVALLRALHGVLTWAEPPEDEEDLIGLDALHHTRPLPAVTDGESA